MTAPVTFLHLTDLHISNPEKQEPHAFADTAAVLTTVLRMARAIEPRPSFVVVSGDIANNADPAAYVELKRLWGDFDLPTLFALGNHDDRKGFYESMLGRLEETEAPYFHDRVIDGIHVIALDSSTPGKVHGTIEPEQFEWLETALAAHPELPKLIVTHHPPATREDIPELSFETLQLADSRRLAEMLEPYEVVGILCGHVHYDGVAMWNGIPVVITNGHHSSTDVLHSDGMRAVSGAGFAIGAIRPSGLTIKFVPLPSDRRELFRVSRERLRQLSAGKSAEEMVEALFPVAAE